MAAVNPEPGTFAGFISSLNQDQLTALADELEAARAQDASLLASAKSSKENKSKAQNESRFTKITKSTRPVPVGDRMRKACLSRQKEVIPTLKRKLRPLNSFIAFRCESIPLYESSSFLLTTVLSLLLRDFRWLDTKGEERSHAPSLGRRSLQRKVVDACKGLH